MNPQKLAGQCAKLKCCLNFEIDAYAEAVKQLPSKDEVLQTKDADYYLFKTDILTRTLTYSTDKRMGANLTVIPASRAFEIIALNKQGIKVEHLSEDAGDKKERREYIDLTDQDALTRFDKAKKKKSKHKQGQNQNSGASGEQPEGKKHEQSEQPKAPQGTDGARKSGNQRRQKRQLRNKDQKSSNKEGNDAKES